MPQQNRRRVIHDANMYSVPSKKFLRDQNDQPRERGRAIQAREVDLV